MQRHFVHLKERGTALAQKERRAAAAGGDCGEADGWRVALDPMGEEGQVGLLNATCELG